MLSLLVFVRYVIAVLVSPYTHCPYLFPVLHGCTLLIRKKKNIFCKTAYHERILTLRIEGNIICKLGQLAVTK